MIVEKLNIIIMNENKFSFEKLDAYREARLLVKQIYELQNAVDLGYIAETNLEKMRPQFIHISRMLSGLRNFYISELNRTTSKPNILKP